MATKTGKVTKWRPILLLDLYRLARLGMTDDDICVHLRVSRQGLWKWRKERPEVQEALSKAREEREAEGSFPDWVYSRLSPELKAVWDDIRKWERAKNGVARIEAMLCDQGLRVRQQLFLHALCCCSFSPSRAMQKVNVSKREVDRWVSEDVGFSELVEEIQWHKGNFFEESLVQLVAQGDVAATLFANKTYNRSRGYAASAQVEIHHSGNVRHDVVDLAEIMKLMSEPARLEMLEAVRLLESPPIPPTGEERLHKQITMLPTP